MKKKCISFIALVFCLTEIVFAQAETVITPSNRSTASMEKNLLFYAGNRFSVSQSGSTSLNVEPLFDGNFMPQYSSAIDANNPYVILIENLPNIHSQAGGWIGWTTRYYSPVKFKIEAYNIYANANQWVTLADVDNYHNGSFITAVPHISVGKIRYTIYQGEGPGSAVGISELFYIHPEATSAYDGMMVKYNSLGNVGIGMNNPAEKLSVNGKIRAHEIKVETANWPDYVFEQDYQLLGLEELDAYLKANKHLPGMPSAKEVEANGVELGEMNKLLLKKVEELTLHLIEKDKKITAQQLLLQAEEKRNNAQEERLIKIENTMLNLKYKK